MNASLRTVLLVAGGVLIGAGLMFVVVHFGSFGAETHQEATHPDDGLIYSCPMHPQVVRHDPGECPICSMTLTARPRGMALQPGAPSNASSERPIAHWRAPMDPSFVSDRPGKSPMGMDLVPVYEDELETLGSGAIRVDPSFVQNFAVRTAVVERGSVSNAVRTVGVVRHSHDGIVSVNTKYEGWIEKAYFSTAGEMLEKGTPLFEIYSPALVATQKEYLAALDYLAKLEGSAYPDAVERARGLLEAARERLGYWDVSAADVERLESLRAPLRTVTVHAPISGFVMETMSDSLEGTRLTPGMTVVKIADHSKVWVAAKVYEHDVAAVRMGLPATVTVAAFPGRRWRGQVAFFEPALDPQSRTLSAFVEIDNASGRLRPGMYAEVVLQPPSQAGVRAPEEAVLRSGERNVVIVRQGPTLFEPREVRLGRSDGDWVQVLSGLEAGDVVVTSSQFLIDSESNLQAAISQLLGENPGR